MDPEMQDLVPVDDPELIALLEQPQSAINKGSSEATDVAYSQSALDAFDRAIESARRLRNHEGLGAAVGSWFDPQAWGSVNMLTEPDLEKGQKPADQYYRGTKARDFASQLDAMRAQVFLPMVQSMKGMGALSNAEGAKLTDAIGALDPGMSEAAFVESLDRIIGDLDMYRQRGAPKEGQNPNAALMTGDPNAAAPPPPGAELQVSEDGSSQFATQRDAAYTAAAQELFDKGASRADMDALAVSWGYGRWGDELDRAEAARAQGARVQLEPPVTGYKGPSVVGSLAATPVGSFFGSAANALTAGTLDELGGAMGGDAQQIQTAKEVMREANPISSFLGETTGAALGMLGVNRLPGMAAKAGLVGDVAYGAAYGAGESNDNRLGGAMVGGTAGAAGNYFGGKLINKLQQRASKTYAPASAARLERARGYGIDLPMGAAGGRGSSLIEKGLDILPGSASVMEAGRETLRGQVGEAVEGVAVNYGTANNYAAAGEALQRGARQWIDRFKGVASKAYDAIPINPKVGASLTNTRSALEGLNNQFTSNPKLAAAFKNTRLNTYLDSLAEKIDVEPTGLVDASGKPMTREVRTSGDLSWEDLKSFRSRIGEEIGDARFSDGTLTSELRSLYGALSEDMRASAATQGPKALRAFDRANTLYRQGQERIDGALTAILGDDGKMAPENAAAVIERIAKSNKGSSDLRKLAEIRSSIASDEWGEVSGTLIRLAGQPRNSAGREFNPGTFVQTFQDMSPPAKNLLFGGANKELRQNLDEFTAVVGDMAANNSLRNTSGTAGVANAGAAIALLPSILFSPAIAAGLAGQAAGSYGIARLWTSPRFVKWATGFAKMERGAQRAGGQPNYERQIDLLGKVARAEPVIAAEALGLQQQLAAAFGSAGPARLAAEEQPVNEPSRVGQGQ